MATISERKIKDGSSRYKVEVRLKGKPPRSATFTRLTDAKRWATQTEAAIREGRYFKGTEAHRRTVANLIDRYLEGEQIKREPKDFRKVAATLQWWRGEIGEMLLQDVSPSVLAAARDRLLRAPSERNKHAPKRRENRPKSPATVVRYMAIMSHAFTIAVQEWEWIDVNPMHKVKKPSQGQPRVRFLDDTERTDLLEACKASPCRLLYPVVVTALSTGARYGEIMGLTWDRVDLDRGVARLETTKNKERRTLPLTNHALDVMRDHRQRCGQPRRGFVFAREDGEAPMEIRKHWNAALEAAGICDFRFHDLRHSAASYLAMNGATLAEIAEVLGHKTLQMVKRYAHLSDDHVIGVVDRMNRAIFGEPANDNEPEKPSHKKTGKK